MARNFELLLEEPDLDLLGGPVHALAMGDFALGEDDMRAVPMICRARGCYRVLSGSSNKTRFCIQHKVQFIKIKAQIARLCELARERREQDAKREAMRDHALRI